MIADPAAFAPPPGGTDRRVARAELAVDRDVGLCGTMWLVIGGLKLNETLPGQVTVPGSAEAGTPVKTDGVRPRASGGG